MPLLKITLVFLLMEDLCQIYFTIPAQVPDHCQVQELDLGGTCLGGTVLDVHVGKAVTSEEPGLLNVKPV